MNHTLEKVIEFHKTFGAPTGPGHGSLALERKQLRIKLIFEELKELAEAMEMQRTFYDLCTTYLENCQEAMDNGWSPEDQKWIDPVATLDAECDLQVVLSGTIIENGHAPFFDDAFAEVHHSNMSKAMIVPANPIGRSIGKVGDHLIHLQETGKAKVAHAKEYVPGRIVFEREDGKILKGPDFKEPDLNKFFDE